MMKSIFKKLIRKDLSNHRDTIGRFILRQQVRRRDFTIIANNCWGSRIYQELGLPYNTPIVGLFFVAPCYIKFLGNLEHYLRSDLNFVPRSRYDLFKNVRGYPIGILGGDVEIHFRHYHSEQEARAKWFRRVSRMNMKRLFIAFSDRDIFSEEILNAFDALPYEHKVCFTARPYPQSPSARFLPEYRGRPYIGDIYTEHRVYKKHFDVADWLNGGTGRIGRRSLISKLYTL